MTEPHATKAAKCALLECGKAAQSYVRRNPSTLAPAITQGDVPFARIDGISQMRDACKSLDYWGK